MGLTAIILSVSKKIIDGANILNVICDPGGGAKKTLDHYAPTGEDSKPLANDHVLAVSADKTGDYGVAGYLIPDLESTSKPGEVRRFARSDDRKESVYFHLKKDGSYILENSKGKFKFELSASGSIKGNNESGSFELQSGGNFIVNGVTIDTNGNITTPATLQAATVNAVTSLKVDNKEMKNHIHAAGTPPGNTGAPQ